MFQQFEWKINIKKNEVLLIKILNSVFLKVMFELHKCSQFVFFCL